MADVKSASDAHSTGKHLKTEGSYYTPADIAATICDMAGYTVDNEKILESPLMVQYLPWQWSGWCHVPGNTSLPT